MAGVLVRLLVFPDFPGGSGNGKGSAYLGQASGETPIGGDFTLQGASGPVSLADMRGRVVLVYFGYTFCPDVCPTSLSVIAQAMSALAPAELAQVRGVFISVDPERDTAEVLKTYATFFHPGIVGVSGTASQVAEVARKYGVYYMKQKPDGDGLYSVDHTSFTYVIGVDGRVAAALPHGTTADELLKAIRRQIDKSGTG